MSQQPMEKPEAYAAFLTKCATLAELRAHVLAYESLAVDAANIVHEMTAKDFVEFRRGLKLERAGTFAGVPWSERFGAVLIPEPMFTVSRVALEYCVPFNVAHQRLEQLHPELFAAKDAR